MAIHKLLIIALLCLFYVITGNESRF